MHMGGQGEDIFVFIKQSLMITIKDLSIYNSKQHSLF